MSGLLTSLAWGMSVGILVWVVLTIPKEGGMNINQFARKVTLIEGKKRSVSIAQVKEILKIVNDLLKGQLYRLIRNI